MLRKIKNSYIKKEGKYMDNGYLKYYGEHHISPVNQDIDNLDIHYRRRRKLYRQCGIAASVFHNAEILEVGPGGGYNTLAFFQWKCKHIDLIEANPKGVEDMQKLFLEQNIQKSDYEIFSCRIEDYQTVKKYNVIIAEGFLPFVPNQEDIINKLKELIAENGIIVVTCTDHTCLFIELIKRLIGLVLTKEIPEYDDKVKFLSDLFQPQLNKMRGVSRTATDWVKDMILNPVVGTDMELAMDQAILLFGNEYDVLGSSPKMFTDYSWYKDIWTDYKEGYIQQFGEKRLSLLMTDMPEKIMLSGEVKILTDYFEKIRKLIVEYEKEYDGQYIDFILNEMNEIEVLIKEVDENFYIVFCEIRDMLICIQKEGTTDMENYPHFFSAFGRAQQYIAFEKSV